jgi:tetratricopeptide (TPR) repeat protein
MNTKLITIGLALFLGFNMSAQKKEVKNAEDAIEDNKFSEAFKELEKAESLGILNENEKWIVRYYNTKGKAFLGPNGGDNQDLESLKKSAKAFNDALKVDGEDADAKEGIQMVRKTLISSAINDQENENFSGSKKKLYASYQLNNEDTIHLYYAAGSAVNAREYEDAVMYYEKLLELGYDGSRTSYTALNVKTKERESFNNKSYRDLMVRSDDYTDAKDEKSPSVRAEIAKNTSRIYIQLEKPEKAMKAIQLAKEMDPDDITMLQAEADLYYQLGNLKKYQELMNVIKDKAPDDAIVYYNLGVSAEQLEDAEAAKGFYKKAIELDPEYVNSYLNLASLILAAEQPLVDEMNELGMSSADNKRYDKLNEQKIDLYKEALPYLQSAYEADDENRSVIQTLINIHYQLGNNDKAKELKTKLDGLAE